ncbi:MAG: hypothetical protein WC455_00320 [Dehalococcoidia bacterium]|jgi:hypothetical protein
MRSEEISPGKAHACPHCGATIKFAGQDLRKVQESIDKLTKELGSASVKVNIKTRIKHPWWQFWKK